MKISIGFSRVVTADPVLTCVRMTKRQGDEGNAVQFMVLYRRASDIS